METMISISLQLVFWISVGAIVHTYALYPLLMRFLGKRKNPSEEVHDETDASLPRVVVLMAVYNEEAVLRETLDSIFENDYPTEKLSVYIGSDNSTDQSHAIIESFQKCHEDLHLELFPGRNGKIRIINHLAGMAKGRFADRDDLVFVLCDANVLWSRKLIYHLSKHFKRPEVGLVASNVLDQRSEHEGIGAAEEAYVNGENLTKFAEGVLWGRTMGAFGACYAMRAGLFDPVPTNYIVDDFFLTINCFVRGRDAIVDPEAKCYEAVSEEIAEEFRRKQRISTGNFQNLSHFWKFFLPWNGGWATWFAFWSHKGLRWTGPIFLGTAMITSLILALSLPFYWLPVAGFVATFLAALLDKVVVGGGENKALKLCRFVRYFYLMNFALFLGMLRFFRGVSNSTWEPTQRISEASPTTLEAGQ